MYQIKKKSQLIVVLTLFMLSNAFGQDKVESSSNLISKKWYESFSIRGYQQVRYNRLFETNDN
jgi:hypothetical protein